MRIKFSYSYDYSDRYRFLSLLRNSFGSCSRVGPNIFSCRLTLGDSNGTQSHGRVNIGIHAIVHFRSLSTMRITFAAFRNRHYPAGRKYRGRIRFPRGSFPYVDADQRFRCKQKKHNEIHIRTCDPALHCSADLRASYERGAHGTSGGIDGTHVSLHDSLF